MAFIMKNKIASPQFVNAAEMGDILGVRAISVRRWAHEGLIPKLDLPSGRFVFDPKAVIAALRKQQKGADHDR